MKQFLTIAFLCIGLGVFAQTYDEASVKVKPQFPGGEDGFKRFIEDNAKRVSGNFDRNDEFAEILFVVETDGSLSGIKANYMGATTPWITEALRLIESGPRWTPANQAGKRVRCKVRRILKNPNFQCFDDDIAVEPAVIDAPQSEDENKIYTVVGVQPEFPGGMMKFHEFFRTNFKMPESVGEGGKVFVSFVVEKDGSLSNIKAIRDLGFGAGAEVIRVLKKSPKWIPGQLNGKPVRVQYTIPFSINFDNSGQPKE